MRKENLILIYPWTVGRQKKSKLYIQKEIVHDLY